MLTRRIVMWVSCVVLLGCGGSTGLHPVSGTVMVNGEPMMAGSVTLHPDGTRGNSSLEICGGRVRDGKYEILTGQKRGAPPGFYRVVVVSTNYSGDNPPPKGPTAEMPRSLIDPKYSSPGTTPLGFEVTAKPVDHAYDLQVTK